jgi:hypothetical protein
MEKQNRSTAAIASSVQAHVFALRRAATGVGLPLFLLVMLLGNTLKAAPLVVDSIYPAGGQRGSTVTVTVSGKFDKTPLQLWADTPALRFEATKASGVFTVKIAADAPMGPHLVRVFTADEVSTVRCFVVGDQNETAEAEPNDEFSKPQRLEKLPALVNGQLDKGGDIDCYAVELQAGQTLVGSVQGRRLGSAIDPMLHLLDEKGNEVAYAQDGLGLDPLLVYPVTKSGTYIVRVSAFAFPPVADVKLAGGKDAVYRLNLSTGPFVRTAVPTGVVRGRKSTVRLAGYNLAVESAEVDATSTPAWDDHLFIPVPGAEARLRIEVGDAPEIVHTAGTGLQTVTVPANITSVIASPGALDHFQFAAKKGEQFSFAIRAEAAGSPLDAQIMLQNSAGKIVGSNDDAPGASHDPRLDWDFGNDGMFQVIVGDVFKKGGADYFYRLEMKRRLADIQATPDSDAYLLAPGKSTAIKLQIVRRNGHATPLMAVATGLPAGVTATSAQVPQKSGDVTITLSAAADLKPVSGAIGLMLLGTDPARPEARPIVYDLRRDKDKPGIPELIDEAGELWLTVSAEPPRAAPKK